MSSHSYLAIGISFDNEGFAASRPVECDDQSQVAKYLRSEFGVSFDQILLVKNDDGWPSVVSHWRVRDE